MQKNEIKKLEGLAKILKKHKNSDEWLVSVGDFNRTVGEKWKEDIVGQFCLEIGMKMENGKWNGGLLQAAQSNGDIYMVSDKI